ncbi:TetR/AcrR family transcriptional regulator [Janthinobacterium sp. BJB304]|uniref:TetR/AcrR family transcriptional regulator n=1 Tax=Janthinobacterium sp. BJB304 TaxID=1572871 RepID=UPI000C0CAEE7|nr:TetR/AcrR family transcriptional regulator [Janthinobacterium sp. BJB304]PHV36932.1 TetR family transcriptional regulator [Janthinobacterium sp. BJB304]
MSVSTRDALLKSAEIQLRSKGYAAFSYADLSEEIGIRKASIHHHFPTKENLGVALITQYIDLFTEKLQAIDAAQTDPLERLREFSGLFLASANDRLLPLCGALAAEMAALPASLQELGRRLIVTQLSWMEKNLILAAQLSGKTPAKSAKDCALMLLSALEGASFIDWALGPSSDPLAAFHHILNTLT